MSFVYYSLETTFGQPLINAETISNGIWTTPSDLSQFIDNLLTLDFANYDDRRIALVSIGSLRIPKFFQTYSFDPTQYLLVPPIHQVRFPGFETYVYLSADAWALELAKLNTALTYRDEDGSIENSKALFQSVVQNLNSLFVSQSSFYDRSTFETTNVLLWSIYPPIIPE